MYRLRAKNKLPWQYIQMITFEKLSLFQLEVHVFVTAQLLTVSHQPCMQWSPNTSHFLECGYQRIYFAHLS